MKIEVGQVCVKTMGHEANEKCVVVDTLNENFVVVAGPRVKKRRCNVGHLELLPHKLSVKKGADANEAIDALLKAGVVTQEDLPKKPEYAPKPRGEAKLVQIQKPAQKPKLAEKLLPKKKEAKAAKPKAK